MDKNEMNNKQNAQPLENLSGIEIGDNSTWMVRKVDELGRVVLPIELRRALNIEEKDPLSITLNKKFGIILLSKLVPADIFTGDETEELIEYNGRHVSLASIMELNKLAGLKVENTQR